MASPPSLRIPGPGAELAADLHRPASPAPWPAVVMGHGFAAERDWGLTPFAERFASEGIAALVFDYRCHGDSGGRPRRRVDPSAQRRDWRAALRGLRRRSDIDAARVALWGTSLGGGHALATAAGADVEAVLAQVPFVDGPRTIARAARRRGWTGTARLLAAAIEDAARGLAGLAPREVPVVSQPGGGGLLDTPDAVAGYRDLVPDERSWANRTPARVVLELLRERPAARADEVDCPAHVVLAEEDRLLPPGATERAIRRLPEARVQRLPVGHFDVYRDPWRERVLEAQARFLREELSVPGAGAA